MSYHNERVKELQNLYRATFPEEDRPNVQWDLDVVTLKEVNSLPFYQYLMEYLRLHACKQV